jgi:hypothetical protein
VLLQPLREESKESIIRSNMQGVKNIVINEYGSNDIKAMFDRMNIYLNQNKPCQ